MITNKANLTQPAEIGQEDVMRDIDTYLREIHFLQERMKEDRKEINVLSAQFDKRMENIDEMLDHMAVQK